MNIGKDNTRDILHWKTASSTSLSARLRWEPENVDDLWNDIQEVIALSVSHYLGTFILAKPAQGVAYDIVDGQQRLTTLTMLLSALIYRLPTSDKRILATERYIRDTYGNNRLALLGTNDQFFQNLLAGQTVQPGRAVRID